MFKKAWDILTRVSNYLSSYFILIIRLYWGGQFVITGLGKLLHLDKTSYYFQTLGIPFPYLNALMAGSTELIGGTLLLLGLFSRIAAIPLFFVLSIAYLTASREALTTLIFNQNPTLFFSDTAFLFMNAVLIVFFFGPGRISVDYWLTGANKTKRMP
jgi:putative oxidoreductase